MQLAKIPGMVLVAILQLVTEIVCFTYHLWTELAVFSALLLSLLVINVLRINLSE